MTASPAEGEDCISGWMPACGLLLPGLVIGLGLGWKYPPGTVNGTGRAVKNADTRESAHRYFGTRRLLEGMTLLCRAGHGGECPPA